MEGLMKIQSLHFDIFPDQFFEEYQTFMVRCSVNDKEFEVKETFLRDDLSSKFDMLFDYSKKQIRKILDNDRMERTA